MRQYDKNPPAIMHNINGFLRIAAIVSLALLLLSPQRVSAATITVSNSCTLANAIRSANGDSATGGCTAGSGADTINVSGTQLLTADLPAITSDITISGGTVDGANSYRPFTVNSGGHLRLTNTTVTKGSALGGLDGGAIIVNGTGALTLTNATVSNSATGIEGEGAGVGGGIYFEGSGGLTVSGSTISGNTSSSGGGLYLTGAGAISITSSVISGNSATTQGAGLFIDSTSTVTITRSAFHSNSLTTSQLTAGVAIHNTGTLTATNSTFYSHSTSATLKTVETILNADGTTTLTHVTVFNNQIEGISNAANKTLNLRNSVIAGNTGNDCTGTLTTNVNNLIQDGTCSPSLSGSPGLASSATGSPPYFLPSSGSALLNAAASAHCLSVDQRGTARPQGNGCDIGAVERVSPTAAFTYSATGLTVSFNSSTSSAGGGNALSYSWAFGDGNTSSSANPSHTYASAGNYSVTLTVSNNIGSDTSPAQTVNLVAGPSAAFTVSKNGLTVSFDSSTSSAGGGNALTYSWTFGDGNSSSSASPSHTYGSAGSYSVSLTVSNNQGSDTDTQSISVDTAANADFTATKNGLTVSFDSSASTGSSLSHNWTFGDGGTSSSANPSHTYANFGDYSVTLTVSNNDGSDSDTQTVMVDSAPQALFSAAMSNLVVNFDGTMSGGSRLQYAWYFNEDELSAQAAAPMDSTEAAPVFTYPACGAYTVRLVVTNADGTSETIKRLVLCPDEDEETEITDWGPAAPTKPPTHTCEQLNAEGAGVTFWAQYGLTSGIQCQRRSFDTIHVIQAANMPAALAAGLQDVIDIWGFTGQEWEICFDNWKLGATGGLIFIEKKPPLQQLVHLAPGAINDGSRTCLKLNNKAGYVLQVARAPFVVMAPPTPVPGRRALSADCMVTANYLLNLRDAPAGNVIGMVAYNHTLTALERTAGWFKVDNLGRTGWIAADYVTPRGNCG